MKIKILRESGYDEAILGLSLSYNVKKEKAVCVATDLYNKEFGHNKFLESIYLWTDVTAPRYWWTEADTYRLSTKQSESTIHTGGKRPLTQSDFEYPILKSYLEHLNLLIAKEEHLSVLKNVLPEGFLQRRIWVFNYKTLRNIIIQRKNHKLPEWKQFCTYMREKVEHKEFFEDGE